MTRRLQPVLLGYKLRRRADRLGPHIRHFRGRTAQGGDNLRPGRQSPDVQSALLTGQQSLLKTQTYEIR